MLTRSVYDTIFKIFRQIDDNHTRKYGGMGLGLSIVKRIIEIKINDLNEVLKKYL
ncbi:MAG TPA: hypothetical protein VMV77_04270 [Bacteroidales bacterium]|nr:hypothetical protein [Bacteroidales bacterium]